MNEKNEPDYAEFRRVMLDNLKRNDVVLKRATMQNPYLIMLFVPSSVGEGKCGRAFNDIFHALGLLPAEFSLTVGDWSEYCGFFLDEKNDAYVAMLNHPDVLQFKKGTEEYEMTLRGFFESVLEEDRACVEEIKAGRLRSESPEGRLVVADELYGAIKLVDGTVVYRDFNADELKRTLGITSICIISEKGDPPEQMRRAVDKVTLMDDSFNECDPDNIPDGFSPTSIAIHIGNQLE